MTTITEQLLKELNPTNIYKEYVNRPKFYFELSDSIDKHESHLWVQHGNGSDEQFWNIGLRRDVGRITGDPDNITIRHGIRYMETIKEFIKWYSNSES